MTASNQYHRSNNTHNEQARIFVAGLLAFIAGSVNVVGFLSTEWFTSHLSGAVTAASAAIHARHSELAIGYGALVLSFVCGSACAATLVAWSHARQLRNEFGLALLLEACLLLALGVCAERAVQIQFLFLPAMIFAMSFLMGMQNALISKLAHASVRTTHVTGMLTDVGIELGRLAKRMLAPRQHLPEAHAASLPRLGLLVMMPSLFFIGGLAGAIGFQHLGFWALEPLAAMLIAAAWAAHIGAK